MSDVVGVPLRLSSPDADPDPPNTLTSLAVVAFVAVALWVGREVFVPIAFAVLLSFVLAPLVRGLRRVGLGRGLSVFVAAAAAFLVMLGLGAVLTRQISELAGDVPRYEKTVGDKVGALRGAAANSTLMADAAKLMQNFGAQLRRTPAPTPNASPTPSPAGQQPPPTRVVVQQPDATPLEILESVASTALGPLASAGVVLVFVIFILIQREDLRDRIIRLAGSHDIQRSTAAIDDAARRLSRYFVAQTVVNAGFGVIVGLGLWLIGVPSSPLWGIIAFVLRFVPYIGAVASAVFPVALSVAVSPGWTMTFETAALFLITEPIMGQLIEPFVYGHSTGLSPVAVLVAATFWTWLWGPVGLILSTPLTVCLVVLGRHVQRLQFLDVLLGDAPPLSPVETFYQRVLAGHPMEAAEQAERILKSASLADYYNEVALPALLLAQADLRRGLLDERRQRRLFDTIEDVTEALSDRHDIEPDKTETEQQGEALAALGPSPDATLGAATALPPTGEIGEEWRTDRSILCVPGRSALDRSAALMLCQILVAHGLGAAVEEGELLGSRRVGALDLAGVRLVCLSYFDAALNPAHVRFAIRRLRRRAPHVRIVGCYWTNEAVGGELRDLCRETAADDCTDDIAGAAEICLAASRRLEAETQTSAKSAAS
jgi:predicted PurR-regulated permease PerM